MDGPCAGLPDFIETVVVAAEAAQVGDVADLQHGADVVETGGRAAIDGVDADETETGGADDFLTEPREFDDLVALRVVVLRTAFADIDHRFGDGFAEADADLRQVFLIGTRAEEFEVAGDFAAEIEDDGTGVLTGGKSGGRIGVVESGLPGRGLEQGVGVLHALFRSPDDAGGRKEVSGEFGFLGLLGNALGEGGCDGWPRWPRRMGSFISDRG